MTAYNEALETAVKNNTYEPISSFSDFMPACADNLAYKVAEGVAQLWTESDNFTDAFSLEEVSNNLDAAVELFYDDSFLSLLDKEGIVAETSMNDIVLHAIHNGYGDLWIRSIDFNDIESEKVYMIEEEFKSYVRHIIRNNAEVIFHSDPLSSTWEPQF